MSLCPSRPNRPTWFWLSAGQVAQKDRVPWKRCSQRPRQSTIWIPRPRMGSTCETTVGRGNGVHGTRGPCRHGGTKKRASIAPRNMTQIQPFAAIRCISRVSLQLGTAGLDPASCLRSTAFHHRGGGPAPVRHRKPAGAHRRPGRPLYPIRAVLETRSRRSRAVREYKTGPPSCTSPSAVGGSVGG